MVCLLYGVCLVPFKSVADAKLHLANIPLDTVTIRAHRRDDPFQSGLRGKLLAFLAFTCQSQLPRILFLIVDTNRPPPL